MLTTAFWTSQQFNTVRIVMSNRLNPNTKWANIDESWLQEPLCGSFCQVSCDMTKVRRSHQGHGRRSVAYPSTLFEGHSQPAALPIEDRFQVSTGRYRLDIIRNHVDIVCED